MLEKEVNSNIFIGDPRLAEETKRNGSVGRVEELYDHGGQTVQICRGLSKWYH